MEVLDIIQSAAFKSGIISSFNPDEMPGDVIAAGVRILSDEILPSLNCDRTIDITVTSRVYKPKNGMIILTPFKQPREKFIIDGYIDKVFIDITGDDYFKRVQLEHPDWVNYADNKYMASNKWPRNDFDEQIKVAYWTFDNQLMYNDALRSTSASPTIVAVPEVNIDFPPMRVDALLDETSRIKYDYVYREEFDQILKVALPGVYTVEEYEDKLIILINGTDIPKRVILPVPLQIINQDHSHAGTIIAPEKFRRYLIDSVAVSLAIVYGVSTVDMMRQQAQQSYELLKKNKTQPLHKMNVSEEIGEKLRRDVRSRRFYENF